MKLAFWYSTEFPDQPITINSTDLIAHQETFFLHEVARNPKGVLMATSGQRSNDETPQVSVQLIWRNDHAGTRLSYLGTSSRIEIDKIDVATGNALP
jgi:hypothetical protein